MIRTANLVFWLFERYRKKVSKYFKMTIQQFKIVGSLAIQLSRIALNNNIEWENKDKVSFECFVQQLDSNFIPRKSKKSKTRKSDF